MNSKINPLDSNLCRKILENLMIGIWITNKNDVITYTNRSTEVISDLKKKHMIGQSILVNSSKFLSNDFKEYYLKTKKSLQTIKFANIQEIFSNERKGYKSGKLVPLTRQGRYDGIICFIEEVSFEKIEKSEIEKQMQALAEANVNVVIMQELLIESEEKYRILSENIKCFIFTADLNFNIKSSAGDALKTLGYSLDRITDMTSEEFLSLIHPDSFSLFMENSKKTLGKKINTEFESRFRQIDATYQWIEFNLAPLIDNNSRVTGIYGLIRNINEKKKAEEQIKNMQKQLLETAHMAGKAQIATEVLHNMGNILNSVNISSKLILDSIKRSKIKNIFKTNDLLKQHKNDIIGFITNHPKGRLIPEYYLQIDETLRKECTFVEEETNKLIERIELLMEAVNSQQHFAENKSFDEPLRISSLIDEALAIQSILFTKYDIITKKNYSSHEVISDGGGKSANDIRVHGQKFKLIYILLNLLKNAAEAMKQTAPQDKIITIDIYVENKEGVYVTISDNGSGIKKEDLEKIFNYGFTTKTEGHGFGLNFCANYMIEIGGKIFCRSKGPGTGAIFTLFFPAKNIVEGN